MTRKRTSRGQRGLLTEEKSCSKEELENRCGRVKFQTKGESLNTTASTTIIHAIVDDSNERSFMKKMPREHDESADKWS